jgi:hypothetical protein
MNTVIILKSHRPDKKYDSFIDGRKIVSFGQKGYEDFTTHKNEDRKHRYIQRHKKNEDWTDPLTAGFYSRWLLWNKETLQDSLKDMNDRFKDKNYRFVLRL